ncbi:MAG TPA: hypothetical protein VLC09_13355 [Polyangiaceae bacterium]|nr:hypothetical protein [Polyangiaceae bacterium]
MARWELGAAAAGDKLWFAVDDHAPRRASPSGLRLGQLWNEDVELSPGAHRLLAVREKGDGWSVDQRAFWVDTPVGQRPVAGCYLLSPPSTINGETAANELRVVVLPTGSGFARLDLSLDGASQAFELRPGEALVALPPSLPSGDHELTVRCAGAAEEPAAPLEVITRVFTVNRDAPLSEAAR